MHNTVEPQLHAIPETGLSSQAYCAINGFSDPSWQEPVRIPPELRQVLSPVLGKGVIVTQGVRTHSSCPLQDPSEFGWRKREEYHPGLGLSFGHVNHEKPGGASCQYSSFFL